MNKQFDFTSYNYESELTNFINEIGLEKAREMIDANGVIKTDYLSKMIKDITDTNASDIRNYKTNIKSIDEFYAGGLKPELYVIGAEPGVGKTTLALQIADGLAVNNNYVAYFSLEMSEKEMMTKSLSRISYQKNLQTINVDCSDIIPFSYEEFNYPNYKKSDNFKNIVEAYRKSIYKRVNLICPSVRKETFTLKDIEATISNYKNIYKINNLVLIIDYLQLLTLEESSYDSNGIRLDTTEIMKKLKKYSKNHSIPIIVISSLNRSSYKKKRDEIGLDCFKETGGIEYTAENLICLTNKASDDSDDDEIFVDLVVLKNRHGKKNVTIPFIFNGKYSCYEEYDQ